MVEGLKGSPIPPAGVTGRSAVDPAGAARRTMGTGQGPARTVATDPAAAHPPTGLDTLVRELARAAPVDATRVDALRQAIEAGVYRPDPVRIAEAMIAAERA
ncbi:MAG: flagellar biosynthesis anti-sigma factor FlgM [Sphingomonadaceae bacterium]|uniref:flagellar biosynthesis anti-sigma factor FlgM n=1 Tax=Thermaurantiacus sp. TaxID=2820283 RepID=UPI00298ED9B1|nr:flagellar biosynthesis anti-sigma factor FlgM [Thermaurantiacus sp.]MCS6985888.1 flagellar biosynthesis anti-sigma factor FlgM [Sphingomonadaceae bacterium]MDW8413843.1 flagellar biosynthesis anti-sigma factor FlgM [Thermaurantiacus sp.]